MIYFIALFSRFTQHYYPVKFHAAFAPVSPRSCFVLLPHSVHHLFPDGVPKNLEVLYIYYGTPTSGAIFIKCNNGMINLPIAADVIEVLLIIFYKSSISLLYIIY